MKKTRRNFIKKSALGISAVSSLGFISRNNKKETLDDLKFKFLNLSEQDYWSEVRNLFPTDKNDTYFNNGTLGVQSNYVLNAVISDMRNNAINGAKTDYKGEGPNLLSGYDPYESIRTKLGKVINCNFKEISLIQNATFGINFVAHG